MSKSSNPFNTQAGQRLLDANTALRQAHALMVEALPLAEQNVRQARDVIVRAERAGINPTDDMFLNLGYAMSERDRAIAARNLAVETGWVLCGGVDLSRTAIEISYLEVTELQDVESDA